MHESMLQSRAGLVLKQMYDQVTQNKPKTSHTGDPPGATRFKVPKARPGMLTLHHIYCLKLSIPCADSELLLPTHSVCNCSHGYLCMDSAGLCKHPVSISFTCILEHCARCQHTKQACVMSEFSALYCTIVDVGRMCWRVNCLKALLLEKDDVCCLQRCRPAS